jgi:D-alanyl-D-alanine carboxypeptidase
MVRKTPSFMTKTLLLLLSVGTVSLPTHVASAQVSPVRSSAATEEALQAILEASRADLAAPGAAASVVFADGRVWVGASGIGRPNEATTPEMAFELGSVTKTYTAALVLQLVADGRMALDDPLARWYPGLSGAAEITVEQLLNHTHGLHDPLQEPDFIPAILQNPGKQWALSDVLTRMRSPHFSPGEGWRYSNTGYHLLGAIIEAVTDSTFSDVLYGRVLGPLGLESTWYGPTDPEGRPLAAAYIDPSGSGTPQPVSLMMPWTAFRSSAGPAGAVVASASDAARWLHALATGGVLGDREWQRMTSWVDRPDGHRYGLGLLRLEGGETPLIGHKGNSAGYSASVFHDSAIGITVAVLTNAHAVDVTPIGLSLLETARPH